MLKITDQNITLLMDIYAMQLRYYAGRLCSCVGENGGQPKVDCGCDLGFYYDDPITIYGIRTGFDYKFLNSPEGRIFDGGARFIIPKYYNGIEQPAYYRIMHGDIISIPNKYRRETEILRKGVRDTLYAFDVNRVFSVSRANKIYREGTDYIVNGRNIIWLNNGDKPKDGEYYSVEYSCSQQFKVWNAGANSRGTTEDELPINVMCVIRRYVDNQHTNPVDNFNYQEQIF